MRTRCLVALPLCLLAFAAVAQTAAPVSRASNDQWRHPVPAASVAATQSTPALPGDDVTAKAAPFKFKDGGHKPWMKEPPPPRANDKAAVMGTQRPWLGGKPPVDCALTPHDPACR